MKLVVYLLVSSCLLFFSTAIQVRVFIIPSLSELHSESDIVMVAELQSVRPTLVRHGNAVEAIARLKVHMVLKGKCEDEVDLEHLIYAKRLPGFEIIRAGNDLQKVEWNIGLKPEGDKLIPEEKKLYLIFAKKTEQGGLSVYRTKSRDCYGVFELSGSDSKTALFMISEDEKNQERKTKASNPAGKTPEQRR